MLNTPLDLLTRIQIALAANLGVVKSKKNNISDFYKFEYCRFINNTTETFLFLVKNERVEASRILVRPALEVTFRLQAIQTKPELLLGVAAWEHEERKKLMNGIAPHLVDETTKTMAVQWTDTVESYKKLFPSLPINQTPLSAFDAAKAIQFNPALKSGNGNSNPLFETYYRFYSPFTHGHIDSLSGEMNYLPFLDNSIMGYSAIIALDATVKLGADENAYRSLEAEFMSCRQDRAATHRRENSIARS
jgi:hypothetical protein